MISPQLAQNTFYCRATRVTRRQEKAQSFTIEAHMMQPDPKLFRNALGTFATGVTIVTTRDGDGHDVGLTASSFNSVSLNPPMILWSLAKDSSNIEAFRNARSFAVHVLAAEQDALSARFARKGTDRFAGVELERGSDGIPLLPGCTARFECRTAFQHEGGDHVIFVREVVAFRHSKRPPLVFHGGEYRLLIKKESQSITSEPPAPGERGPDDLLYLISRAYHQLRGGGLQERRRRGWSEAEYSAIGQLSMEGDLSLGRLDELVAYRGHRATPEVINALEKRGLVGICRRDDAMDSMISLTPAGRKAFIEVIAFTKAAEADALTEFEFDEFLILKQLLQRLVRKTNKSSRQLH